MDNTHTIFANKNNSHQKEQINKLQEVVVASSRVLLHVRGIFPFDFFPDEIIIHETKVDIIYGLFFFSKKVLSVPIENIYRVNSTNDLFFGTLIFELIGFNETPAPVKYLWVSHAMKVRRVVNGLILCHKQKIDLKSLDINLVRKKVEEIGST